MVYSILKGVINMFYSLKDEWMCEIDSCKAENLSEAINIFSKKHEGNYVVKIIDLKTGGWGLKNVELGGV